MHGTVTNWRKWPKRRYIPSFASKLGYSRYRCHVTTSATTPYHHYQRGTKRRRKGVRSRAPGVLFFWFWYYMYSLVLNRLQIYLCRSRTSSNNTSSSSSPTRQYGTQEPKKSQTTAYTIVWTWGKFLSSFLSHYTPVLRTWRYLNFFSFLLLTIV